MTINQVVMSLGPINVSMVSRETARARKPRCDLRKPAKFTQAIRRFPRSALQRGSVRESGLGLALASRSYSAAIHPTDCGGLRDDTPTDCGRGRSDDIRICRALGNPGNRVSDDRE
jgi:hypothetical protein